MSATASVDWTGANQRALAGEIAWLKRRLGPGLSQGVERHPELEDLAAAAAPTALDTLTDMFQLSSFERSLLLMCAGVELDAELAAMCASLHDDDRRRHVTFGLALGALPDPHWSALTLMRPLRRWRLIDVDHALRLVDSPLRIDERILHFLAGINLLDSRLQPLLTRCDVPTLMAGAHADLVERMTAGWASVRTESPLPVIHLSGDDPAGQEDVAAMVADRAGLQLFVLNADDLPLLPADLDALLTLCDREMRLVEGVLLLECGVSAPGAVVSFANRTGMPLFVATANPLRLRRQMVSHAVDKPQPPEQKRLWIEALEDRAAGLNGSLDALSMQFRLSARTIASIAASRDVRDADVSAAGSLLRQACRIRGRAHIDDLAERIVPAAGWDDLVLPESSLTILRQIAAHVRQRVRVQEEWGFAARGRRGAGISALFCGESGTGKTLAAEVLAHEIGLDLYRIDLSSVVSKYIGETEKNLKRVFDAAEDSGAILLFDEADALFGKRSEVKDSHDRYANIEISYLLQRMEAYSGLALLTTNMKTAIDRAFQRRLRFVVNFPFPDGALREAIWRRVFPPATPLGALDYQRLARLNLPGGSIRNIALNAAFLAADGGVVVQMDHLRAAARAESLKLERPLSEAETRGWL